LWWIRKTIPVSRWWSGSPPKFNHYSLADCQLSLKISRECVWKFLRKVANRQTYNDENITSLMEITTYPIMSGAFLCPSFSRLAISSVIFCSAFSVNAEQVTAAFRRFWTKFWFCAIGWIWRLAQCMLHCLNLMTLSVNLSSCWPLVLNQL